MNPLEDIIYALKAKTPEMPFGLPHSYRLNAPNLKLADNHGFTQVDPWTGNPATVNNKWVDYKSEYVWHCHILGHEENDFMRPFVFDAKEVLPGAPTSVAESGGAGNVTVSWVDPTPVATVVPGAPNNEIGFRVERSDNGGAFAAVGAAKKVNAITGATNALANSTSFLDLTVVAPADLTVVTPSTPTIDAVTANSVSLLWTPVSGATGYNVFRNGSQLNTAPIVGTAYIDTNVTGGISYTYTVQATSNATYSYRVAAVTAVGESLSGVVSTAFKGTTSQMSGATQSVNPAVIPDVPTNVALQMVDATSAIMSWTGGNNTGSFAVQSSPDNFVTVGNIVTLGTVLANGPAGSSYSYSIPVAASSNLYYRVVAMAPNVVSGSQQTNLSVAPSSPTGLTATPGANLSGSVSLAWTAGSNNATSYTVTSATNRGLTRGVATSPALSPSQTSYIVTGLRSRTTYFFRVAATNAAGSSTSTVVSARAP